MLQHYVQREYLQTESELKKIYRKRGKIVKDNLLSLASRWVSEDWESFCTTRNYIEIFFSMYILL